ncbi:hypothetical protein HGRIS_000783 [Hohenbuehelia grisea]|uniref:Uncharacterized protein n=1 Tax=Hohenbuehelia grisea TaxID=104357 RepID=A0ABR3IPQ3_9AGAR
MGNKPTLFIDPVRRLVLDTFLWVPLPPGNSPGAKLSSFKIRPRSGLKILEGHSSLSLDPLVAVRFVCALSTYSDFDRPISFRVRPVFSVQGEVLMDRRLDVARSRSFNELSWLLIIKFLR